MGKGLAGAFAAGIAMGVDKGLQRNREQARQDREDQNRQDEHDARMADVTRVNQDRIALANAAKPVSVDNGAMVNLGDGQQHLYDSADVAGSDVRQANRLSALNPATVDQSGAVAPDAGGTPPDAMSAAAAGPQASADPQAAQSSPQPTPQPAAPVSLSQATMTPTSVVGGTAFQNPADAAAAASLANTPQARDARIAQTLRERGNPVGAMQYEASARQSQGAGMDLANKIWSQHIREAVANGHQGLADLVSQSQGGDLAQHQIKAVPSADGQTVTYAKVNPDGSTTPLPNLTFDNDQDGVIKAAYMLDRSVDPATRYKNMLEEDKQTASIDAKTNELELRKRQLDEVQIPNAQTRAALADVKAELAQLQSQRGSTGATREERLRYTSLFTDAGRRMHDTQAAISQVQRDDLFMRAVRKDPNGPEAQQIKGLQAELASHAQERELYRGLLVNSQAPDASPAAAPSPAPAASPAGTPAAAPASATKVSPTTQAARDSDRVSILNSELTKAKDRLAAGDPRAQGDIDALNREIGTTQVTLSRATPKVAARVAGAGSSRAAPVAVKTAAERDALPKGSYYTAPNGQTYIKQ